MCGSNTAARRRRVQFTLARMMMAVAIVATLLGGFRLGNRVGLGWLFMVASAGFFVIAARAAHRCADNQWDFDWDKSLAYACGWTLPACAICLIGMLACPPLAGFVMVLYGPLVAALAAVVHRSGRVGLLILAAWATVGSFVLWPMFPWVFHLTGS